MNKPTQDELQAGIDAAAALTESTETPEEPATPEPEVEAKPQVETPEIPVETPQEPATEETPAVEAETDKPAVDYKEKFVQSSRESLVRESLFKKTNEAIDQAANLEITEEDLKREYPEWDLMSETEKLLAKRSYLGDKRFELIHKAAQEGNDIRAWNEKVDAFIDDPKVLANNPDLEGKQDDFKIFATKPTRRGSDFETLVSAFLFSVEQARPKHTGKMFETGVGGPNEAPKPKSDKLSVEESEQLRTTNYAKYKEYLKAGKIAENIE